jgi:putative peptide zinc metalloprotease protein
LASVLLFLIPIPFHTTAQGVVWVPDQAQVRSETDGFIQQWLVRDGERVETGQVLVVLDDPALHSVRAQLQSRLAGLETEQFESLLHEPARVQNILQDIEQTKGELARIEQRIEFLQVRSLSSGTLVIPRQEDLLGTLARKGHVLGYILDNDVQRVRAAVPEADAALVRDLTRAVEVRLAEALGQVWPGTVEMDVPAATRELPSAALGDRGGGALATDPSEEKGLRTVEPIVLIDLHLPAVILRHIGERAWIRFDHGTMSLAQQSYRRLKLLFLRHFSPTG